MRVIAFLVFTALSITPLHAAEFGTKDDAVAMVKRVQEMFKEDGADATIKAVSDPSTKEFHDCDLYPFIYVRDGDKKGLCVAHGARPALIGKNLLGLKDPPVLVNTRSGLQQVAVVWHTDRVNMNEE